MPVPPAVPVRPMVPTLPDPALLRCSLVPSCSPLLPFQEELDSTDTSVVISSCSLAEARLLLDNFLKASIDKVRAPRRRLGVSSPPGGSSQAA